MGTQSGMQYYLPRSAPLLIRYDYVEYSLPKKLNKTCLVNLSLRLRNFLSNFKWAVHLQGCPHYSIGVWFLFCTFYFKIESLSLTCSFRSFIMLKQRTLVSPDVLIENTMVNLKDIE